MIQKTLLALAIVSAPLLAVELSQATNEQILNELAYRLHSSPQHDTATALYTCDSAGYMKIDIYSNTSSQSKSLYTGGSQECNAQTPLLTANRSKVTALMIAAVCDSAAYLYKLPLRTDGTFGTVTNVYVGDANDCLRQAKLINSN